MMTKLNELPEPLNAQERLLYAIAVRQDMLIQQMNSVVDYIAKQENVATTSNVAVEEVAVEAPKRAPRKRKVASAEVTVE